MQEHNSNTSYESVFFIVPSYILKLPGLTLGFLKVYETIFQFWNKGRICFLSNGMIQQRTGLGITQVKDALLFFEKAGELRRINKAGKRYLSRPERFIETDESTFEQVAAPAAGGSRSSGLGVAAPAAHNIKNRNKEINVCEGPEKIPQKTHTQNTPKTQKEEYEEKTFNIDDLKNMFQRKFAGRNITYEKLFEACCDYHSQKGNWVSPSKWKTWIENERLDNYSKNGSQLKQPLTEEQKQMQQEQMEYHEYKKRIEHDRLLKLPSGNQEILSFDTWKAQHAHQG